MLDYFWLMPFVPLLGFAFNGLIGKKAGDNVVAIVGSGVVGLSFLLAALVFFELLKLPIEERLVLRTLYPWIVSGDFAANLSLRLDPLSMVMALVVTGVGFIIHVYSIGYMAGDRGFARFFAYMNLFAFSMLLLVLANNFLLMFVGWEGVGLCSYLLIGFWYEEDYNAFAGRKAFVVNRIGDFGFLLGILLIFFIYRRVDYDDVFRMAGQGVGRDALTAITLLLFVGAVGKSAQLPLYVWLPDAMAGPTPVSALIHAATMVTAGVYMVARCHILYSQAPISMALVAIVGAVTALYSASIALTNNDIKRVLAYSTISQLGYMFLACGVGAFVTGIFHLATHAFFKALLFLGAGSVMHALGGHETDLRKMGALKAHLPVTYWTFLVGALAISGIPPLSGFFSKDEILFRAFLSAHRWIWIIGLAAAAFTAFYMFRLVFLTFRGESRLAPEALHHVHESPPVMTLPLVLLAILSFVGGGLGIPESLGGSNAIERFLHPVFKDLDVVVAEPAHRGHASEDLEFMLMGISVAIAVLGIGWAYVMYVKNPALPRRLATRFRGVYTLLYNKYYVDEIYDALVVRPVKNLSDRVFWRVFDVRLIDGAMNGMAELFGSISGVLRRVQTGVVQNYALSIVLGVVTILAYFLLR